MPFCDPLLHFCRPWERFLDSEYGGRLSVYNQTLRQWGCLDQSGERLGEQGAASVTPIPEAQPCLLSGSVVQPGSLSLARMWLVLITSSDVTSDSCNSVRLYPCLLRASLLKVSQRPLLPASRLNKKEFTLEEIYTNKNYQSPTARR